jgi:hypothetical protein
MAKLTLTFVTAGGFMATVEDDTYAWLDQEGCPLDLKSLIESNERFIKDAGGTPAASAGARAVAAPAQPANGYPADLPERLHEAWDKKMPTGNERTKGFPLGPAGKKQWEWYATEGRFEDMKTAAKALLAWKLGLD